MKSTARCAALLLGTTQYLIASSALAHHSFAQFDTAKCQTIAGTVRNVVMSYPHAWVWLTVANAKGGEEIWGFEGAAPVALQRLGWTRGAVKPGDKLIVRYSPLKDGRHGGSFASVRLSDGRELHSSSPACLKEPPR